MEVLLGAQISRIGSGKCPEREDCIAGCWVRPEVGKGYALVDAQSSSVVGPKIYLASGCGCHPPKRTTDESDPVEPRPVVKASEDDVCVGEVCLNGGRCVPELSSFRSVGKRSTLNYLSLAL